MKSKLENLSLNTTSPETKTGILENLSTQLANEPDAAKRLTILSDTFRLMARTLHPEKKAGEAIRDLVKAHRAISIVWGFLSANYKLTQMGYAKSFSYQSLDILYIVRALCQFYSAESNEDIPVALQEAYSYLRPNYELAISKSRLDSKINELMISKNSKLVKRIWLGTTLLVVLLLANLACLATHLL